MYKFDMNVMPVYAPEPSILLGQLKVFFGDSLQSIDETNYLSIAGDCWDYILVKDPNMLPGRHHIRVGDLNEFCRQIGPIDQYNQVLTVKHDGTPYIDLTDVAGNVWRIQQTYTETRRKCG